MKIYVLTNYYLGDIHHCGYFSTKEKAEKAKEKIFEQSIKHIEDSYFRSPDVRDYHLERLKENFENDMDIEEIELDYFEE